jgi:hypothetical protein
MRAPLGELILAREADGQACFVRPHMCFEFAKRQLEVINLIV